MLQSQRPYEERRSTSSPGGGIAALEFKQSQKQMTRRIFRCYENQACRESAKLSKIRLGISASSIVTAAAI
jgi:hypothetical protein